MPDLDTLHAAMTAMVDTDREYSAALEREYGRRAGDVRYRPDQQTEEIRALGDRFKAAAQAWREAYRRATDPGIARP